MADFVDPMEELKEPVIGTLDSPNYVVPLWGYLVAADSEDDTSPYFLYQNLRFDEYFVIKREQGEGLQSDYVYHYNLFSRTYPLAGSIVWVRGDAKLSHTKIESNAESTRTTKDASIPADAAANMLLGTIQQQLKQGLASTSPLPLGSLSGSGAAAGSFGGCGTGNNTPGCPYVAETTHGLPNCP